MECKVCLFKKFKPILEREYPRHVICENCGFVFMEEMRSLRTYYENDYWKSFHGISGSIDLNKTPKRSIKIYSLLKPLLNVKSRCLEIGAGFGYTLNYIRKNSRCSVFGIEPSKEGSQNMISNDIPCFQGSMEQFSTNEKFDIIILSHVFEHFEDPVKSIQLLKNLLATDGTLYIEVPNILQPEWYKNFKFWFSKEHYYYYSLDKLNYFFNACGFSSTYTQVSTSIISLYKTGKDVQYAYTREFDKVILSLRVHEIMYYPSRFIRNVLKIFKIV